LVLCLCLSLLILASGALPSSAVIVTIREVGDSTLNTDSTMAGQVGSPGSFEVVVDTEGGELYGFAYGITFDPGSLTSISHTPTDFPPFMSLGPPAIDEAAGTITQIAQFGVMTPMPAGVYVVDTFDFTVATIPISGIFVQPGFILSGESFIIDMENCPSGPPVNCTVTFHSLDILEGLGVPLSSPLAIALMIGLLIATSFWILKHSPQAHPAPSPSRHSTLLLIALALFQFSAQQAASNENRNQITQEPISVLDASSPELQEKWGVEVVWVRLTAADLFLDFRYRVLDVEKAKVLFGPKVKPYLLDSASGERLLVPNSPKLGSLKATRSQPYEGRSYFVFFNNIAKTIQRGQSVSVGLGAIEISGLTVQ
jgi:hypothetical protein